MTQSRDWRAIVFGDTGILILLALLRFVPLILTNGQSGWHRDELDTLENARYLDWGYVSYPPVAPFIARVALTLFGPSTTGVHLFSTLAQAAAMLLAGLLARELGGRRWAQALAAVAVAVAPYGLLEGVLFHYSSFDYLWWTLIAYMMIRLLKSDNPRWWLGIGAVIGVGMMTKYTMALLVAGIVVGVVLTRARRYLASPWLWAGVTLSVLIVLPNLIWQIQHNFISLDFVQYIHARDVHQGRADAFLMEQFIFATNIVTVPFWLAGLYGYLFASIGRNYRALGWMFLVAFALLVITQGRTYYFAPAYPMLFACGAALIEQWLCSWSRTGFRVAQGVIWAAFAVSGVAFALVALPVAPINSSLWDVTSGINGELKEMVGWPELVDAVAGIYAGLPEEDKSQVGILAGNYGEMGAINLYGSTYGLPKAISGVNSYWLRGYGDPAPQTLILVGFNLGEAQSMFESCKLVGRNTNRYGVTNEESKDHPLILLCRGPRLPWSDLWKNMLSFG